MEENSGNREEKIVVLFVCYVVSACEIFRSVEKLPHFVL